MPAPLLATKLYRPRPRAAVVLRGRLHDRLDGAARLVLVSAPAGFGKTALLTQWAPTDAGWLSLDRGDDDPVLFWTYVVTALRSVAPQVGEQALALLASDGPAAVRTALTTLLNDLAAAGDEVVLVLDDYHLVETREVHEAMAFLVEHAPPRLRLILAARADPPLPLARLRARGELVEVRATDLRFTASETATYLVDVMGLPLTGADVTALGERTEGWVAALQLAALSMQGRDDLTDVVAGFSGDDRYVVDYLVEEVLHRQPAAVREFLLRTSVLARLTGPLCEAVTGQRHGRATLEALDRANLFVVPLDDHRGSYRYHHLFGDVLQARLGEEYPDLVPALHRRASDWYAEHDEPGEAIRHAAAAQDLDRAADLIERAMPAARQHRRETALRQWLELLPAAVLEVRPVLSNGLAGALLSTGTIEGVDQHLRAAERWCRPDGDQPAGGPAGAGRSGAGMVAYDEEELRRVPVGVAVHRAGLALALGDPAAAVGHARRALELLEPDHHLGRGAATGLIGLASWMTGDLGTAAEAYAASLDSLQRAGHRSDVLGCSLSLADIQLTCGRLRDARRTLERGLLLAPADGPPLRGTADMHVGLGMVHVERGDLPAAIRQLALADQLGSANGLRQNAYRRLVLAARLRVLAGDPDGAVALLDEAERRYVGDLAPDVRPVAAARARVLVTQGRLAEALDWAREHDVTADDALDHVREYEHVTLARTLLARAADRRGAGLGTATALLDRLAAAAETGGRTGPLIEVLVLAALARRAHGDARGALAPLRRALALAEPEGYVQVFVDEGSELAELLRAVVQHDRPDDLPTEYAARLLGTDGGPPPGAPGPAPLVDPLSDRERDVLRLLTTDLSGPEIADALVVSLNTVRTHTKSIYAKLGVNSRRAAVRRAAELDLLSRAAGDPANRTSNHHTW